MLLFVAVDLSLTSLWSLSAADNQVAAAAAAVPTAQSHSRLSSSTAAKTVPERYKGGSDAAYAHMDLKSVRRKTMLFIVIPHLEMCACHCHWLKSRHMTYTESQ